MGSMRADQGGSKEGVLLGGVARYQQAGRHEAVGSRGPAVKILTFTDAGRQRSPRAEWTFGAISFYFIKMRFHSQNHF